MHRARTPGHTCASSDLNYLVVAVDRIPWGHLNVVDLGTAGYRIIAPGTRPLACADIEIGDLVEIDGRNVYRSGPVAEKGDNLHPEDGSYFPCMIAAHIQAGVGDSGGAVLVRGIPAGVTSRSFGGWLGFTPLAEGLAQLGLELCTTPDCGLVPPVTDQMGSGHVTTSPASASASRLSQPAAAVPFARWRFVSRCSPRNASPGPRPVAWPMSLTRWRGRWAGCPRQVRGSWPRWTSSSPGTGRSRSRRTPRRSRRS